MLALGALLTTLIQNLRRVVLAYADAPARPPQPVYLGTETYWPLTPPDRLPPLPGPVWMLFWVRLLRVANRLRALHERWQAGTLPKPRPRRPRSRPAPAAPPATQPPPRLPRAQGWAAQRIPQAARSGGWLHYLLQEPHTRDFVQAVPQAGRLLRPLCVALGVAQPDWLRLPERPRKPRARPPVAPDSAAPAPTPDRPLPRHVLAAAKAWKKRYG